MKPLCAPLPADPPQPLESAWRFVEELQSPLWRKMNWRPRTPFPHEASLLKGVTLDFDFEDPAGALVTAYEDFRVFLRAAQIDDEGSYRIFLRSDADLIPEAYRITVGDRDCEIAASTTEGIRRGLFFVEDQILRSNGPFLPLGVIERRPVIRTRISRCFFGPIHRPPKNRDELTDDINYYPDEYLNRLAHEGVNGLWLTIHFNEVCRSSISLQADSDIARRLDKLRVTVARCARYGIKIYFFANEPVPLSPDDPLAKAHPELLGSRMFDGKRHHFCTSTRAGQAYLEEALFNLFSDVPGLGGLINITVGEGESHCYSGLLADGKNCPRCAVRSPHEVLHDTLAAMERGIHAANPEAELISWPYFQFDLWGDALTVESAAHNPPGVVLQHNFESSGEAEQCGRIHKLADYWLSWPGPSQLFIDCARKAREQGTRMGAKLQVGCSHEVATAPYVPVPGHLYVKYKAMHELGVSSVMQCWYFGNYPGLMTRAAGELSFAPLPETESDFLHTLALREWGHVAGDVVRAWEHFQKAYASFPLNHVFGWFGPVHDAPVWPLYLEPVDRGISPSWLIGQPSGDRFGECFAYTHSLQEVLLLTRAMADEWDRGAAILRKLRPGFANDEERSRDIGVALALGVQFESAANMIEFYSLREELPHVAPEATHPLLQRMRSIVRRELERDDELISLCENDSRLGFHSEAEGYKYFPEKIRWRMRQLNHLLEDGFPKLEALLQEGVPLWPEYTGRSPQGKLYQCLQVSQAPVLNGKMSGPVWESLPGETLSFVELWANGAGRTESIPSAHGLQVTWKACHSDEFLYLAMECSGGEKANENTDLVRLLIEPRRLWPNHSYEISRSGELKSQRYPAPPSRDWTAVTNCDSTNWSVTVRIAFSSLSDQNIFERPLRLDLERCLKQENTVIKQCWIKRNPLEERLVFGTANSADMGWLILCPQQPEAAI